MRLVPSNVLTDVSIDPHRARLAASAALFGASLALGVIVTGCGGAPDSMSVEEQQAALRPIGEDGPVPAQPNTGCLSKITASLAASVPSIDLGQSVTLRWNARVPSNCAAALHLTGYPSANVPRSGSLTVTPMATSSYALAATLPGSATTVTVASVRITVVLPPSVAITSNDQAPLLVQALGTPGTIVTVANSVVLDLSYREPIPIRESVTLQGGRTSRDPGPLLYTTTRPGILFDVQGDNVRIAGLRIRGTDLGVSEADYSNGISSSSYVNLEITNNELYGWSGSAVRVNDNSNRIDPATNPETVRVHDNYIHHNQHVGSHGYGVVVGNGAYALIERNVFDWNRHAIAGDGSSGSGYHAYSNLILKNGGLHRSIGGVWTHTHQFDMHGQDSCGVIATLEDIFDEASLFNCGTAGYDMIIRNNTFLYTSGPDIKLRGTPERTPYGAFVGSNVFAQSPIGAAIQQEERGLLIEDGNVFGFDGSAALGSCDFDADGIDDSFMATGQTWWFSSRGTMPWSYLNNSPRTLSELTLVYADADPRCDVIADGIVYSGGRPARRPPRTDIPIKMAR